MLLDKRGIVGTRHWECRNSDEATFRNHRLVVVGVRLAPTETLSHSERERSLMRAVQKRWLLSTHLNDRQDWRAENMSSRGANALKTTFPDTSEQGSSDVHIGPIQRKFAKMLRRADARELALKRALLHSRATEAQLRLQLDREQRRHTIENRMLHDRLRRLEQCLLSIASAGRRAFKAPLAALRGPSGAALGPAVPFVAHKQLASSSTPVVTSAVAAQAAPFDPIAIVESMLPLNRDQLELDKVDIAGALERLRTLTPGASTHRWEQYSSPITATSNSIAPASRARDEQEVLVSTSDGAELADRRPSEEHIGESGTPWFPRAFRRLVEEDPQAAGRLLLQLLPAQGLVWPEDVAYRIEVAETGMLAVEVRGGRCTVQALLQTDAEVQASEPTLRTDLAGLARTIVGRRGWSRVGARITGSRNRHLRPLRALAGAPLELSDLRRVGAQPDPVLLLRLLALAVDPEWTAKEVFTIECRWRGRTQSGCYIHVFENAPIAVTSAPPLGRVAATLTCEPGELLEILVGEISLDDTLVQVSGNRAALGRLLEWFRRVDATATTIPVEASLAQPGNVSGERAYALATARK
jgi:hypothetical protein